MNAGPGKDKAYVAVNGLLAVKRKAAQTHPITTKLMP
jgi:hypothetical protein